MFDRHSIFEASRRRDEGVRRFHLQADGDIQWVWAIDCRLREPQSGRRLLLLHGGARLRCLCAPPTPLHRVHVQGGSMCADATSDLALGVAYRSCDPCGCTVDSRSGDAKVPFNGCANHTDRGLNGNPWCFVAGGTACRAARADPSLPGAAWKPCSDPNCQCVPRSAYADTQQSGTVEIKVSEQGCGDHDGRVLDIGWYRLCIRDAGH